MNFVRSAGFPAVALALALALGLPQPIAAQFNAAQFNDVTRADVQRLQDDISQISRDVAQLRGRDTTLASQLQAELDDASDEAIYLKVKLRKNEPISRSEFLDVRDKIEDVRTRARGDSTGRYSPPRSNGTDISRDRPSATVGRSQNRNEVPVGTEIDVRLQQPLGSRTAQVEDRFQATTMVDVMQDDRVLIPAGSVVRGIVTTVNRAGRIERKGSLTVAFDQITIRGRTYPIRATVTDALESEGIRGEAGRIGTGAGIGAVIGGILGGVKGAIAGILIGGGGMIAATEGDDVELPAGAVLRVRLDSPLTVR